MATKLSKIITNDNLSAVLVKESPSLEKFTSQGTASIFKDKGFENALLTDINFANGFFSLTNRFFLNIVNIAQARDIFEEAGIGEEYASEYAAEVQRMAVLPMKPISPRFTSLTAQGANMQAVRLPKFAERFFTVNDNFQNFFTWNEWKLKQALIGEYGWAELYAGAVAQMANSYKIHKSLAKKACLNAAINSTANPLKDTQKITMTSWSDPVTDDELTEFLLSVMDLLSAMGSVEQTDAYNAYKDADGNTFKTVQDKSRLHLLCRPGLKNRIGVKLKAYAFNAGELNLDVPITEVDNFGGIEYYSDADFTTRVYPAYDANTGEHIGWNAAEGQTTATYTDAQVYAKDPNENVLAILLDKGAIFRITHNEQRMIPAPYNAAGLYVTNWFSAPGNVIKYDPLYTFVTFNAPGA